MACGDSVRNSGKRKKKERNNESKKLYSPRAQVMLFYGREMKNKETIKVR